MVDKAKKTNSKIDGKPAEERLKSKPVDGVEKRTGISRRTLDDDSWRVSLDRREDWELRNAIAQPLTEEERDKLRTRLGKARLLPIDRRIGPRDLFKESQE